MYSENKNCKKRCGNTFHLAGDVARRANTGRSLPMGGNPVTFERVAQMFLAS